MNTLILLEQNGEKKKQPQNSLETHTSSLALVLAGYSGSLKGLFQRLQERVFQVFHTWAVTAAQMTSLKEKSVHHFETSSWVGESPLRRLF